MPRKKHLILTYGVSEGRQRTVVLSLSRVNALLAALAIMAVWSFGSVGYFMFAGFKTEVDAVATVVPEPRPIAGTATDQAPQTAEPAQVPEVPEETYATTPEPVEQLEPVTATPPASEPVQETPSPVPATPALAASIENYRAKETIGKLVTHFAVRNLSNATLRGKVIGEAEFVALDGSVKTITSEQDYKARTLSVKQLQFVAPGPGKFTKVHITVNDRGSPRILEFTK